MRHILLIDPETTSLKLTKKFLENHGYEVNACTSAAEALDLILDPKFDLIISEIDILGLDGFDLCAIIKKYQIDIPVLFLTNRDDQTTRTEAVYAGVEGFISKQFEYVSLPRTVRKILQEKSSIAS